MTDQQQLGLRERNRQETRLRIEDAATAMFLERGVDAVTVEEICERVGISRRTFFNYFESKDQVIGGTQHTKFPPELLDDIRTLTPPPDRSYPARVMELVGRTYLEANKRFRAESIDPDLTWTIHQRRTKLFSSTPTLMLARLRAFESSREHLNEAILNNLETQPDNRQLPHLTSKDEALLITRLITTSLWTAITLSNQLGDGEPGPEQLTTIFADQAHLQREFNDLNFTSPPDNDSPGD